MILLTKRLLTVALTMLLLASCGANEQTADITDNKDLIASCCTEDCSAECKAKCEEKQHACAIDPNDKSCCTKENGESKDECCNGEHAEKACCSKEN